MEQDSAVAGLMLYPAASASNERLSNATQIQKTRSFVSVKGVTTPAPQDKGYPGFLTNEEFIIFERFHKEVYSRSKDFRSTVFSFASAHEEVEYALCRWLRARKFILSDTIKMVKEAMECSAGARTHNFYPCPDKALCVERSLYIKNFPQVYYGHAKNGCPVYISQPGLFNAEKIMTLTNVSSIINYHWYAQMYEFSKKLDEMRLSQNGGFKRYECVCIIDLARLTSKQLNKTAISVAKEQSAIDSLCFPETLSKLLIINAPTFFTVFWRAVRRWLDQRTTDKIEVVGTNRTKLLKSLSEVIEVGMLPSDFGGNGMSIKSFMKKEMVEAYEKKGDGNGLKLVNENDCLIHVKGACTRRINVDAKKIVKLSFVTKAESKCAVQIIDSNNKVLSEIEVMHRRIGSEDEYSELPTRYNMEDYGLTLKGPEIYEICLVAATTTKIDIVMVEREFVVDEKQKNPKEMLPQSSHPNSLRSARSICAGSFHRVDE
uniref:CRAL-TRIO domain-containing protein n=1 Tax=Chaetoceros debilis TaxID=122233 RepID=A0A7S3Q6Q1_9STRA|mmetsp:Transcript_22730/g.34687  ORF Transcript_22730/g.34687 Transcript_22730/m.34687 type:complete len:488 (+) Transcript_22730:31-1494(+)